MFELLTPRDFSWQRPLWVSSLPLLQRHQGVLAELVGELLLHLEDLSGPGVVPQGAGHLLVGHGPLVALSLPPQCRHLVLVRGGKLEDAGCGLYPGHAVGHVGILQHLKEEMKEPHLPTCKQQIRSRSLAWYSNNPRRKRNSTLNFYLLSVYYPSDNQEMVILSRWLLLKESTNILRNEPALPPVELNAE